MTSKKDIKILTELVDLDNIKVICEICKKPFSEDLDFVGKKRTYTKRLAQQIIEDVLDSVMTQINKELDTQRKTKYRRVN